MEWNLMEFTHLQKFRLTLYLSVQKGKPLPQFQIAKISFHLTYIKSDYCHFTFKYIIKNIYI